MTAPPQDMMTLTIVPPRPCRSRPLRRLPILLTGLRSNRPVISADRLGSTRRRLPSSAISCSNCAKNFREPQTLIGVDRVSVFDSRQSHRRRRCGPMNQTRPPEDMAAAYVRHALRKVNAAASRDWSPKRLPRILKKSVAASHEHDRIDLDAGISGCFSIFACGLRRLSSHGNSVRCRPKPDF